MRTPAHVTRQAIAAAAAVAVCLLVLCGSGYRVLAHYLAGATDSKPLPPETLAGLPMQIADWVGEDAPLDEAVVRATDTDAHISRRYSRGNRVENVWAYVAYGVRARDLMPHRPEVCYPGNGWTLDGSRMAELLLADGSTLACRILRFSRGRLAVRKTTVLNYYIVDGKCCPDVSLLRSRAWRGSGTIRYVAQVQITCSDDGLSGADVADKSVRAFAVDSGRAIRDLFSNAEEGMGPNAASPDRAQHKGSSDG